MVFVFTSYGTENLIGTSVDGFLAETAVPFWVLHDQVKNLFFPEPFGKRKRMNLICGGGEFLGRVAVWILDW